MNTLVRTDVAARAARERVLLAVALRDPALALEACRALTSLFEVGYVLFPLADTREVRS